MLETALYVLFGVAALIAIVLVLAWRQPDQMKVERSAEFAAPPEAIFPLINDLRQFSTWSPFEKDPDVRKVYSGADRGAGQRMEWAGNSEVGEGALTILSSVPHSRIDMQLAMVKPMHCDNHVTFTLVPSIKGTTVIWSMGGDAPLIGKVMSLFVSFDRMCGAEFERGLGNLKALVERAQSQRMQA